MTRPTRPGGPSWPDDYSPESRVPDPDPADPDDAREHRPPSDPRGQRPPPPAPGPAQPTFTPRQAPAPQAPQSPPPGREPASYPYEQHPRFSQPQQQQPYSQPPDPQAPARGQASQPTFTPRPDSPPRGPQRGGGQRDGGQRDGQQTGRRHGARRRDDRPRPTFTPREGYLPPPDSRRRAAYPPPPTAFLPPPPGYPQQTYPIPYDYPEAPPAPRRGAPEGLPQQDGGDHRPRILEVPGAPGAPGTAARVTGPQPAAGSRPNLARSSQVMALGTLVARLTGFLRTFVFVFALGAGALANAYNNSNTLPNTVYYLMLGGIFTSVVVPLLVRAAKEDQDRGEGYAERIFTLGVISLLTVTVLAMALAAPIVNLYAGNINGPPGSAGAAEHHLMVVFAYFFIPQIFFYGMDSLLGAILNTKGRFGANMWTPVINNVVVIVVGGLFIVTEGLHRTPQTISPAAIKLLGIGTTLGILIQSIALFPVLRRAGFSMRLRWDLRRTEIAEIGMMAGWMFFYVASQWAGNLVVQRVANVASAHGATQNGFSAYSYAWQLFQLPYAVVGISVISALLPRMSGHANDRRYSRVREDFSTGVRLASVIVVPAAVFLAALGAPLCEFLFSYGSSSTADGRYIGEVFGVFALGLVPFMLTQLQLRVFYSFQESRTPAIIGMVMLVVGVLGDLIALSVLPPRQVVIGLAAAYGLMTLTGAVLSWVLLLRRVGSLDGWRITRSLVRMFLAAVPGLVFAFATMAIIGSMLHGAAYGLVSTIIGGGGALLLYAFCARMLGIEEFRTLVRSVAGRFGR